MVNPVYFKHEGIYKESIEIFSNYNFIVCAMFTPGNAKYFRYANRLITSCEKYSLPYSIYKVPDIHTSININGIEDPTFTKANLILFNLQRFPNKNVLYVDVDIFFMDYPRLIVEISNAQYDFAIYNWLNDEHNEAYVPFIRDVDGEKVWSEFYRYSHHIGYFCNDQLICSGGVQFYQNTSGARNLLLSWQKILEQNPESADDECLDYTYNNLDNESKKIRSAWLDKSYLRLPWWPHVKPVIIHPDLPIAGSNRYPFPKKNTKKRFYVERCKRKGTSLYFPPDYIIDTKKHLLLKIENSQLVDVKEIHQEFWIYHEYD